MSRFAFAYILGASHDPNGVRCVVPFRVDENLIFFGPCKKRLRDEVKRRYLPDGAYNGHIEDDVYFIGLNASNEKKVRKIVWVGKLVEVMTFEYAYNSLSDQKFYKMRNHSHSPLHVKPLYNSDDILIGYQHNSKEHMKNDSWISDLERNHKEISISRENRQIFCDQRPFSRDVCMLFKNIFFAVKRGITIDEEILEVFKRNQPDKSVVDAYAVFGYDKNGKPDGKVGGHLTFKDGLCDELTKLIIERASML